MSRRGRVAAAVALAVLLAGCGQLLPGVDGYTPSGPVPATAPATSSAPVDLVALRRAAGIEDCPPSSDEPAVAGGLPDLVLECLGGDTTFRLAGLRGPVLVNLWAQWCEPCRAESASLAAFAASQDEVAVLGINYSDPQPELAIEFARLTATTYPHLWDEEHTLKGPLGVAGIPYTVLVDADGRVVARHPGMFVSLENVQQWVAEGLAG